MASIYVHILHAFQDKDIPSIDVESISNIVITSWIIIIIIIAIMA